MDSRRGSSAFIVCMVLIISGSQGQPDDFMKICDLCNVDGLQDCNSTFIFHINMTINCEMTNKMCTLGINEFFEGFENLTLHDIDKKHICIFKEMSMDPADMSSNVAYTDSKENLEKEATLTTILNKQEFWGTTFSNDFQETSLVSREINDKLELTTPADPENNGKYLFVTSESIQIDMSTSTADDNLADGNKEMQNDDVSTHLVRNSGEDPDNKMRQENNVQTPPPPDETIECFACESSSNDACIDRIEELKTVDCQKHSGCISYFSDGNIVRNCGSVISPEEADLCRNPDNTTCDTCPSSKCNTKLWKQCFKCNSDKDPNCAQWSSAETVPISLCPSYDDNCLVRITKPGDTIRDCTPLNSNSECGKDELCSICEGPLCNAGIFPPERLQCIQCQECEDAQSPDSALPCARYNVDDKCFLYVTVKSRMNRGCVSNITEMQACQNNEPKCTTCKDKNGCNSEPLMKEPSLSCSKCNSKDHPSCAWEQPEATVSKCINKYLYHLKETCLTQFNPSTEETVRDCSFDFGVCTPEDQNCKSCPENGCNRDSLKSQYCIQCQSDQQGQIECRNQAAGIESTKCSEEHQTFESRGCFTLTKGNITLRGCVVSLSTDDLKLCKKKGQNSCIICLNDSCNNVPAPSISSTKELLSLLTISLFSSFLIAI